MHQTDKLHIEYSNMYKMLQHINTKTGCSPVRVMALDCVTGMGNGRLFLGYMVDGIDNFWGRWYYCRFEVI